MALLAVLWSAGGRIVSRDRLYDALHGLRAEGEQPEPQIIGVYVCKLRKWLSPVGFRIECCHGRGLALVWPDEALDRRAA